jgi:hypothetical protein
VLGGANPPGNTTTGPAGGAGVATTTDDTRGTDGGTDADEGATGVATATGGAPGSLVFDDIYHYTRRRGDYLD